MFQSDYTVLYMLTLATEIDKKPKTLEPYKHPLEAAQLIILIIQKCWNKQTAYVYQAHTQKTFP